MASAQNKDGGAVADCAFFDEAGMGSCIVTLGKKYHHKIVGANPAFCKLVGYPEQLCIGSNCRFIQAKDRLNVELKTEMENAIDVIEDTLDQDVAGVSPVTAFAVPNTHSCGGVFVNMVCMVGTHCKGDSMDERFVFGFQKTCPVTLKAFLEQPEVTRPHVEEFRTMCADHWSVPAIHASLLRWALAKIRANFDQEGQMFTDPDYGLLARRGVRTPFRSSFRKVSGETKMIIPAWADPSTYINNSPDNEIDLDISSENTSLGDTICIPKEVWTMPRAMLDAVHTSNDHKIIEFALIKYLEPSSALGAPHKWEYNSPDARNHACSFDPPTQWEWSSVDTKHHICSQPLSTEDFASMLQVICSRNVIGVVSLCSDADASPIFHTINAVTPTGVRGISIGDFIVRTTDVQPILIGYVCGLSVSFATDPEKTWEFTYTVVSSWDIGSSDDEANDDNVCCRILELYDAAVASGPTLIHDVGRGLKRSAIVVLAHVLMGAVCGSVSPHELPAVSFVEAVSQLRSKWNGAINDLESYKALHQFCEVVFWQKIQVYC